MQLEIIQEFLSYDVFAGLFVGLLFYVLKENSKREQNYQDIISELSKKFDIVEDMHKDVKEIKG